jgi:ZIP family zinc transporter
MEITSQELLFAFGLTLFAGLSTGIGSALAFFTRQTNTKFLAIALGFSAGVMIYVAFVEIFFKAKTEMTIAYGESLGFWLTTIAFFGGIFLIALIDRIIPSYENPHEVKLVEDQYKNGFINGNGNRKLLRMGAFTALAIAIHNFPEGIATFTAALTEPELGIAIAVAIALHNIPEGIAVSVPVFFATGSKRKAFWYSFASGLAEPLGAVIAYLILLPFMTPVVFGILFAAVAGIMVFISIDELLPASREYGEHHLSIYGLIGGMIVMAFSLLMFVS